MKRRSNHQPNSANLATQIQRSIFSLSEVLHIVLSAIVNRNKLQHVNICTMSNTFCSLLLALCSMPYALHAQNVGVGTTSPQSLLHLQSPISGDTTGLKITTGATQHSYIYHEGTNLVLRNKTNANQLVLASNGDVGLGTDAPGATLHVLHNNEALRIEGTNAKLSFYEGASQKGYLRHSGGEMILMNIDSTNFKIGTNNINNITIAGNGKVGIGTTNPANTLHVNSSDDGATTGLRISSGSTNARLYLENNDLIIRKGSINDQLVLDEFGNIGIGINAPVDNLHVKGSNGFVRLDGAEPGLTFFNDSDWLGSIQTLGDNLRIQNRKAGKTFLGNNGLIQFTMNVDGLVGLGTQSPLAKLHTASPNEGPASGIRISAINGTQNSVIYNEGNDLYLGKSNATNQLVLDQSGSVGIGTNAPAAKLQIDAGPLNSLLTSSSDVGTWLGIGCTDTGGNYFQFISTGSNNGIGAGHLAIYGSSTWNTVNNLAMVINGDDGRVAIGTTEYGTGYKLSVGGKIISEGLRVQAIASWPDYVFESNYNRLDLSDVESFIDTHGHLPGFDPASLVESEGLDMGTITVQQQEWIEVSTLYILEQEKRIEQLEATVKQQSQQIELLLNHVENK